MTKLGHSGTKSVTLTLPDGSHKQFATSPTGLELAQNVGAGLAKAALAIKVDGRLQDLHLPITRNAHVAVVTAKSPEGLELLRHDAAHVMAEAVKELYPDTQITIGPVIEDGFFYDFARPTPFTEDDLASIEARMRDIVKRDEPIRREVWERAQAIAHFKKEGEHYKAEIIAGLPQEEEVSLYRQGAFVDLCRGPHLPSTGKLGTAFKLTKVAGAYWRGDSNNEMLTRIYGTCWATREDLDLYLKRMEEAEKRDHRRIGREMDLFHFQDEAAGMAFWHENGWTLFRILETYLRRQQELAGYKEIKTPLVMDRTLWEKSGHWEKFRENMYVSDMDERVVAIKPMNCPGHVQVFNQTIHSYRELPLRISEFGHCHRYEPSGALHGLMRVRAFIMDDAHIFCREDQITSETMAFCQLLLKVYKDLGFEDLRIRFSDRPAKRAGSDEVWDKAESALKKAVQEAGLEFTLNPGEGAFYGPKLEFVLRDTIGRDWQCGTWQVDFVLPERLNANYIGMDGNKHRPVMLHRAILGSFERFIGILIEHYAGKFPLWLSPVQAMVATITSDADAYAQKVLQEMEGAGLRARIDLRNEKITYKVREHSLAKVPVLVVVGKREAEEGTVSLRRLGSETQTSLTLTQAIGTLVAEAQTPR